MLANYYKCCSSINDHAINNSYSRYLVGKTQVFIIPTLVSCDRHMPTWLYYCYCMESWFLLPHSQLMRGSRNFRQGGVQVSLTKKSSDVFFFFFFFFFLVLSLFYRSQMVNFKEIYHFSIFQGSRGGPTFSRGVQLFPGGVQLLIPYRNPYILWFSRGGPDPLSPPLDPHLQLLTLDDTLVVTSIL